MMRHILLLLWFFTSQTTFADTVAIDLDLRHPDGIASGQSSGLLHSISATEPPDDLVNPLQLKFWRGAELLDNGLYARLKKSKAIIQYVVSDIFNDSGDDPFPHQDPVGWRKHVEQVARKVIKNHWDVVWEPWNEPDYWPGEGVPDRVKYQQYLDAFKITYQIIKSIDPNARFSGPSLSAEHWPRARQQIEAFLAYCAQHNLEVNDLTWHGFDDRNVHKYPERIQEIRQLAANRYPTVKVERIFISEIISERFSTSPGDLLVHLKYLDDAKVDGVGRACWSEDGCWLPTLDGVVTKDVGGTYHPTPLWWANYWYASLHGQRFSGRSTNPGIAASAVRRQQTLSVLVGYSAAAGSEGSHDIVLNIAGIRADSSEAIQVMRLNDLKGNVLDQPAVMANLHIERQNDHAFLKFPAAQAGDAYLVTMRLK